MAYDRQKYLEALKAQVEENIFSHSLALEACMAGIYDYLQTPACTEASAGKPFDQAQGKLPAGEPSKEEWCLAGLIHDIDFGGEFKEDHPHKTKEALAKYGLDLPPVIEKIVKAHAPEFTGVELTSKADWAIFCADSLTGLITAVAFVYPSRKLADVKLNSVLKRFLKDPKFAAGTRREEVAMCAKAEGLNIPVEKFIEICLTAMQGIAGQIGL